MITWPICVIAVNLYVHCPLKFLSRICNTIVNWYYYCLLVSPLSTGDIMSTGATNVYWWRYHCLYYCYYCLSMYNFLLVLLFSTCLLQFFFFFTLNKKKSCLLLCIYTLKYIIAQNTCISNRRRQNQYNNQNTYMYVGQVITIYQSLVGTNIRCSTEVKFSFILFTCTTFQDAM